MMDNMKKKGNLSFSLSEFENNIKEMNKIAKNSTSDSSFLFLIKQHSRTQFITFVFIRILEEELVGSRVNDNLLAILLNALDYIKKNFKAFSDIIFKPSSKPSKKDLNSNPFGVMGGSRNGFNKENYGGASNT